MLELFACRALVNHAALVHNVLQAIAHPGVSRFAVAPGTARFLVIAFNIFGHVQVRHKAHIGLVDAHAKGHGGDHHNAFAAQKPVLVGLAHRHIQPRVVRQRVDALVTQHLRHLLHPAARLAVHDARLSRVLGANETQQLLGGFAFFDNGVADVGAVKTADKLARLLQLQALHDVLPRQSVGSGRQRNTRHLGKALVQHRQRPVFGAEVVPPLAHAMRLINGEQGQLTALVQGIKLGQETRRGHPLRGGVQHRDVTAQQTFLDLRGLFARQCGIQECSTHPRLMQSANLVVHQGNQGRNHHRDALACLLTRNGRYLVAQRLAATRGHQHQGIAPCHHMLHDGLLRATELVVTKNFLKNELNGQNVMLLIR